MLHLHVFRVANGFLCKQVLTPVLKQQQQQHSSLTTTPCSPQLLSYGHSLVLCLCSSAQSFKHAQQVHALATITGALQWSASILSSLMLTYATYASSSTSRLLFNQGISNWGSAFLWNTLIRAYSIAGIHCNAFETYNQMVRDGIQPDDHTFPFVLKVCIDEFAVEKGLEIHGLVFKLGFDRDVFVGNTLISFYAPIHYLDANRVFNEMFERDLVSWNSIMAASLVNGFSLKVLEWFLKLNLVTGFKPNSVSIITVLPACAGLEDEETVRKVHGYVVKSGLDSHLTVCNALIDVYGKCGNCAASKLVYDQMFERNVVSWNTIIAAFARESLLKDALDMFRSMVAMGKRPDSVTMSTVLPVLLEVEFFHLGKEIHAYTIRRGIDSDVFVSNCLIDLYAKSGHFRQASTVFHKMDTRSIVTWNAMVANFVLNKLELEAIRLIATMQNNGEYPNSITFTNVLPAIARMGFLRQGMEIHAVSIRKGFALDLFVSNALTDMYSKCNNLTFARNVFETSIRDEVSYNILIMGYSQSEYCYEAITLFSEMRLVDLKHDTISFMGALSACGNLPAIKQGKEIHGLLIKAFHCNLFVANSLLDMYTKCGKIDLARRVFDQIPDKDVVSWNTMILGYGMHGEVDVAIDLFDSMRDGGVDYDLVSYVAVLSACSHGGMVERGLRYFHEMLSRDIRPTNMHYACMVDLLGRAGRMKEAVEMIRGLPIEPDVNVWGSLLGACRVHGNIELGQWAAEHLFELKPEHCGYYVLMSNMYAEAGKWEEANETRELMKSRGGRKNPGCSWVDIFPEMPNVHKVPVLGSTWAPRM